MGMYMKFFETDTLQHSNKFMTNHKFTNYIYINRELCETLSNVVL